MKKHFVVFNTDIFLYDPETDNRLIKEGHCVLCENIKEAKETALQNLLKEYNYNVEAIKVLKAGDFK